MKNYRAIKLTDKNNSYLDTIASWMYEWWGESDGWSINKVHSYVKNCISDSKIRQTIVAIIDNKIVDVCHLLLYDLDSRPDIYPWLANLFIDEKYRKQGIASLLINNAIERAKELGLNELYLYTKNIGLYEKFGFKFVELVETFKPNSPIERLYRLGLR